MCDSEEDDCGCTGPLLDSSDVRTAIISGETFKNRTVQYAAVDGIAMFEGCIALGPVEEVEARTQEAREALDAGDDPEGVAHGVVVTGANKRWPGGLMPYTFASGFPAVRRQRVMDAIAHWEQKTSMRFVKRTASNASQYPNYVNFKSANGCWSYVGMQGNKQDIGLASGCGFGATVHEIGHAWGLWHEQSREDRDSHVRINWQNITAGKEHNFNQHISDGDDVGSYDYGSIMHYGRTAFSKNGQPTIVPLTSGKVIGQRSGLSAGDIAAVHSIYQIWHTAKVNRVFATHGSKNAYVMLQGQSWRRLDPKSEDGVQNMLDICAFAKAFNKSVSVKMDGSKVYQAQLV